MYIYIYIIPDSCKFADMMICLLVWCYHSAYQIVSFMYAKYGRMYESTCAYTYTYTYTYRISIYILHSSHIDMTYCTYNIHIKYIHIKYIYIYIHYIIIFIYIHTYAYTLQTTTCIRKHLEATTACFTPSALNVWDAWLRRHGKQLQRVGVGQQQRLYHWTTVMAPHL